MKPKRDQKTSLIAVRFKPKERDWIERLSRARGLSKSAFIRNLVLPSDYVFGLKKELTSV